MNKTELLALAERVEQADGPNYALEQDIAEAVWRVKWNKARPKDIRVPNYTASIDAALTLVPDGHFWSITMRGENRGGFHACCAKDGPLDWRDGAHPALAMTAAALRAIAGGADD